MVSCTKPLSVYIALNHGQFEVNFECDVLHTCEISKRVSVRTAFNKRGSPFDKNPSTVIPNVASSLRMNFQRLVTFCEVNLLSVPNNDRQNGPECSAMGCVIMA